MHLSGDFSGCVGPVVVIFLFFLLFTVFSLSLVGCRSARLWLVHGFVLFFPPLAAGAIWLVGRCLSVCPQVFLHLWVIPAPLSLPAYSWSICPRMHAAAAPSRGCFSETRCCSVEVDTLTLWVRCHGAKCNTVVLTHIAWWQRTGSSRSHCPTSGTFI